MAEGIRIKHMSMKAPVGESFMILAIRDKTERINGPYPVCSVCSLDGWRSDPQLEVNHDGYKTRHIEIDSDGYAIVSTGVLEGLSNLIDHGGFDIINTISNPPRQVLSMDGNGVVTRTVVHKVPREIVTKGVS